VRGSLARTDSTGTCSRVVAPSRAIGHAAHTSHSVGPSPGHHSAGRHAAADSARGGVYADHKMFAAVQPLSDHEA
jgi:hypothetical protein